MLALQRKEERSVFDNKSILITGGTGSFGQRLTLSLEHYKPKRVTFPEMSLSKLKCSAYLIKMYVILSATRDRERLIMACKGVDIIVHAAAMKSACR